MTDQKKTEDMLTAEVRSLRKSVDALVEQLDQMHANMQKEFAQQGQRVERCVLMTYQLSLDLQQRGLAVSFRGKGNCEGLVLQGILLKADEVDAHGEVYSADAITQAARQFIKDNAGEEDALAEVDRLLDGLDDVKQRVERIEGKVAEIEGEDLPGEDEEEDGAPAATVLPFKKDT